MESLTSITKNATELIDQKSKQSFLKRIDDVKRAFEKKDTDAMVKLAIYYREIEKDHDKIEYCDAMNNLGAYYQEYQEIETKSILFDPKN
jgi:hypothetical protein